MTRSRPARGVPLGVVAMTYAVSLSFLLPSLALAQRATDTALDGLDRVGSAAVGTVRTDAVTPRYSGLDSVLVYPTKGVANA
jgi:hypothetical protein